jgi:hypothetical protein
MAAAAAVPIITCPECKKKFRPKADLSGKKIKCPFCTHAFVVPLPEEAKAAARAAGEDEDIDPYGVTTVDLVPRCPNCTTEMKAHEIVCLACGYNTLTRQWGKTTKTLGVSGQRHFMYLLPALGSAAFTLFFILALMIFYSFFPDWVAGTEWYFNMWDSEAVRMWSTMVFGFLFWIAGVFCFKRFIEKPVPDEIELK